MSGLPSMFDVNAIRFPSGLADGNAPFWTGRCGGCCAARRDEISDNRTAEERERMMTPSERMLVLRGHVAWNYRQTVSELCEDCTPAEGHAVESRSRRARAYADWHLLP